MHSPFFGTSCMVVLTLDLAVSVLSITSGFNHILSEQKKYVYSWIECFLNHQQKIKVGSIGSLNLFSDLNLIGKMWHFQIFIPTARGAWCKPIWLKTSTGSPQSVLHNITATTKMLRLVPSIGS